MASWCSKYTVCEFQFQKVKLDNRFYHPVPRMHYNSYILNLQFSWKCWMNSSHSRGMPIKNRCRSVLTQKIFPRNLTLANFARFHSAITILFKTKIVTYFKCRSVGIFDCVFCVPESLCILEDKNRLTKDVQNNQSFYSQIKFSIHFTVSQLMKKVTY
jgi:hypothetical protein